MKYFDIKDPGEDLPSVSNSNRRVSIDNNMSDLVKKLDGVIDSNIELYKVNQFEQNNFTFDTHKVGLINCIVFFNKKSLITKALLENCPQNRDNFLK